MVHLTDHMEGRTCCLLAVCAHFVQRKVILAYCGHTAAHGSNMPQVFRWCLDAVAEEEGFKYADGTATWLEDDDEE